jgi:hypothetical protein
MTNQAIKATDSPKPGRQGRSPAYPGLDLKEAIGKAKALYEAEGKYPAPMPSAFKAWGFSAKSSGGREVRAALRYFGLITVDGDGETGKVKLTDKALRIILDDRSDQSEKEALIRELALAPAIHKQLFERFPEGVKSDDTVEHFLVFEENYNKSAASELVAEFKITADYAGLFKPAKVVDIKSGQSQNAEASKDLKDPAKIGDLVQVEIGGSLQFEKPKRVRAIQEHGGKFWVFVDGHEAGVQMEQVHVVEGGKPSGDNNNVPPRLPLDALPAEWREERLLDEGGEEIFIRYKGDPSRGRYEFIRDYLDFKLKRMK